MNPSIKIKNIENAVEVSQSPAVAYEKIEKHFNGNPSLCDLSELFIKALKKVELQDKADEKRLFPKQKLSKTYPTDILKTMPKAKLTDIIDLLCDKNGNFKSCDAIKTLIKEKDAQSNGIDDIIASKPTTDLLLSFLGVAGNIEGKNPYILMAEIIEPSNPITISQAAQEIVVANDNIVLPASTSSFARFVSGCSVLAKAAVKDIAKKITPSKKVRTACTESVEAAATSVFLTSGATALVPSQMVAFLSGAAIGASAMYYYTDKAYKNDDVIAISKGIASLLSSVTAGTLLVLTLESASLACGAAAICLAPKATKKLKKWATNALNTQKQITRD